MDRRTPFANRLLLTNAPRKTWLGSFALRPTGNDRPWRPRMVFRAAQFRAGLKLVPVIAISQAHPNTWPEENIPAATGFLLASDACCNGVRAALASLKGHRPMALRAP